MAGALRKTMIYLGLADGDEHYESEHHTTHKDEDEPMEARPRGTPCTGAGPRSQP